MPYYIPSNKNMRDNYHGVSRLHDDIDRLFNGALSASNWLRGFRQEPETVTPEADFIPHIDILGSEESYTMRLELPGVEPEDVHIKVADKVLTVSGEKKNEVAEQIRTYAQERSFGTFARSLTLPDDADMESIRAFSRNGVLSVEIPRKKPEAAKTRTIEIQKG